MAAVVLFAVAVAADWGWVQQTHEGGFIALGLACVAAAFIPWRDV